MREPLRSPAPRVLALTLGPGLAIDARPIEFEPQEPALAFLAGLGGSGLAVALLSELDVPSVAPAPLVVAVGPAVRAGLPTAARATVAGRAPLDGRLAEGQVGSDLAERLASLCDGLVIAGGGLSEPGVVVLEADGSARVEPAGDLLGLPPGAAAARLEARFGPHASLRVGPAALAGVCFAGLAAGGERPSFVGRGGLGALLGTRGVVALVVRAVDRTTARSTARPTGRSTGGAPEGLVEALAHSPRLAARAAQGTAELWHALAARGELRGPDGQDSISPEQGARLAADARSAARERHGCRGCPTPCGWVFERPSGERQRSHFGAAHAVGPALGLERFGDSLELLAVCDSLGVDAKESGALLATWCAALEAGLVQGVDPRGDARALAATLERLLADPRAARGAGALARALGLATDGLPWLERRLRAGVSGAALLGQCVSSGGSDPMRSFPFLADDAGDARIAALTGLEAPTPGVLVWWHESLVAALDASGFCAFSAAGLLADSVCTLDQLAAWLGFGDGEAMIAAGAGVVLARRALDTRYGAGAERDRPPSLAASLDRAGMLEAYRSARGVDPSGHPLAGVWASIGGRRLGRPWSASSAGPGGRPSEARDPRPVPDRVVRVRLRATGPLLDALGERVDLTLDGEATVGGLLTDLSGSGGALARLLGLPDAGTISVWREGRRLGPGDVLRDGDVLDLVQAIAGG